jgi:GT2 family glycosyltransferase
MTTLCRRLTVDVLIPTYQRPAALAVTLTSLAAQTYRPFRVIVSDQTPQEDANAFGPVQAAARVLDLHGTPVEFHKHLPRRGIAEQRQFLLDQARAEAVLCLDDDVICEPDLLERLVTVLAEERCGFVGSTLVGLRYRDDVRPHEHAIELWDGPVQPEHVHPGTAAWERWRLHNAANPLHIAERLGVEGSRPVRYKVAWIAGCVLFDTAALRCCGGFEFWRDLPAEHAGEDVVAQQRVMAHHGGCGILPSGAYHQDLPTTIVDRRVNALQVVGTLFPEGHPA